jgi:hypothetical protein
VNHFSPTTLFHIGSNNYAGIVPRALMERPANTYISGKRVIEGPPRRQATEGVQAMADYRAAEKATLAKTARLKAERLVREVVIVPEAPKRKKKSVRVVL